MNAWSPRTSCCTSRCSAPSGPGAIDTDFRMERVWSSEFAPAGCAEALAVVSFTRRLLFVDGVNDRPLARRGNRTAPSDNSSVTAERGASVCGRPCAGGQYTDWEVANPRDPI